VSASAAESGDLRYAACGHSTRIFHKLFRLTIPHIGWGIIFPVPLEKGPHSRTGARYPNCRLAGAAPGEKCETWALGNLAKEPHSVRR